MMKQNKFSILFFVTVCLVFGCGESLKPQTQAARIDLFRCVLTSPGGDLVFGMRLISKNQHETVEIVNGSESIVVSHVTVDRVAQSIRLEFDHYDSVIEATWTGFGEVQDFAGRWRKQTANKDEPVEMKFRATHIDKIETLYGIPRTKNLFAEGRWQVVFASETDSAVGVFKRTENCDWAGTFLTTTGDYRYLAGNWQDEELKLSCFDGAHAFLFQAKRDGETLRGDFWSGTAWHDTWIAERNDQAQLADPLGLSQWNEEVRLRDLRFMGLDGKMHSLGEPQYAGRAIVLQLFGTWCPNCHDAAEFMSSIYDEYREQGLSVVGLAFELSDDFDRNKRQVVKYIERHQTKYPVLIAGLADKDKATDSFRALDRVRSFPTTLFLTAKGEVHAIYTGFSGPATGEEFQKLKNTYHEIIKELLSKSN